MIKKKYFLNVINAKQNLTSICFAEITQNYKKFQKKVLEILKYFVVIKYYDYFI